MIFLYINQGRRVFLALHVVRRKEIINCTLFCNDFVYLTITRVAKARAKLEEQELSSPLSALSVNIIYDMVASHLTAMAMDVRPCFKVSKLLAIDAICCGIKAHCILFNVPLLAVTCKALHPLSGDALESCLTLIHNALIGSGCESIHQNNPVSLV